MTSSSPREEALLVLDAYVDSFTESFVNLAKSRADNPTDRDINAHLARTLQELDLLLRVRDRLRGAS